MRKPHLIIDTTEDADTEEESPQGNGPPSADEEVLHRMDLREQRQILSARGKGILNSIGTPHLTDGSTPGTPFHTPRSSPFPATPTSPARRAVLSARGKLLIGRGVFSFDEDTQEKSLEEVVGTVPDAEEMEELKTCMSPRHKHHSEPSPTADEVLTLLECEFVTGPMSRGEGMHKEKEVLSPQRLPLGGLNLLWLLEQIERAWWRYEDEFADVHSHLEHLHLHQFVRVAFGHFHCMDLREGLKDQHNVLYTQYKEYQRCRPVFGCLLLNKAMTRCVLVQNWHNQVREQAVQ